MLNKPPPLPKYYQLAQILSGQISSGQLQPHDQLPTEEELCAAYQVSRGTVREAVRLLMDEGLIVRERGRGTFVKVPTRHSTLFTLSPFAETIRRQNRLPTTRVLTATAVAATPDIAERLTIPVGEPTIQITRLRLADNQPVSYETRYLAQSLCPTLLDEDLANSALHTLLVSKYQIPLVKMVHTVEVGQLAAAQAALLETEPNTSAFFVDRLTYTEKEHVRFPAVWFQAIYREDNYNIGANLQASL